MELCWINDKGTKMLVKTTNMDDLRVRRTLHLLQEKFWELLAKQSFQSITVQDITTLAMVNRATFYDHFDDKYELLQYSIHEWFKETLQKQHTSGGDGSTEELKALMVTTCTFLANLRDHCMPKDNVILPFIQTTVTDLIAEILISWMEGTTLQSFSDIKLNAAVTSWAIYGAASFWSQQEKRDPVDHFVLRVLPTIQANMRNVSGVYERSISLQ
jgi:AcrR family transcriptional regulator